jgi:hypothetical protein
MDKNKKEEETEEHHQRTKLTRKNNKKQLPQVVSGDSNVGRGNYSKAAVEDGMRGSRSDVEEDDDRFMWKTILSYTIQMRNTTVTDTLENGQATN